VAPITFWLDDEAIQAWYESATPSLDDAERELMFAITQCWSLNAYSG
jgi:hypothetical protein